jgi:hypothetical protein
MYIPKGFVLVLVISQKISKKQMKAWFMPSGYCVALSETVSTENICNK